MKEGRGESERQWDLAKLGTVRIAHFHHTLGTPKTEGAFWCQKDTGIQNVIRYFGSHSWTTHDGQSPESRIPYISACKTDVQPRHPQEVWGHPEGSQPRLRLGVFTGTSLKDNLSQLACVTGTLEDIYQGPVSFNKLI